MKKPLTIGRLAQAAGVNLETIRYYQRIGLINEPEKPLSGYRIYSLDFIKQLGFIKQAKTLGFKLEEIAELLSLCDVSEVTDGAAECYEVRLRAERKRLEIINKIKTLKSLCNNLDDLIANCHSQGDERYCPLIDTLSGEGLLLDQPQ